MSISGLDKKRPQHLIHFKGACSRCSLFAQEVKDCLKVGAGDNRMREDIPKPVDNIVPNNLNKIPPLRPI
jgi:Fe-S cluster biogenesis protein NfuA